MSYESIQEIFKEIVYYLCVHVLFYAARLMKKGAEGISLQDSLPIDAL